ncbi:hypothetical protein OE88DRAFT_1705540 [Heliocybe sulcata]|uniref:Uncharacterized protein n=1 Tax=Heliocybe sulcata TaxID=5364 RepID=A0A5C3MR33_9AGAM|nr:hypothetical protein OE88DRAFT_1705540 [Heliocybe sulcata]
MRGWKSPIYAFFEPTPDIVDIGGRRAHVFRCSGRGCKEKVRRYLDKKDAGSTGNMRKHVKACWGEEALKAAEGASNVNDACERVVKPLARSRSILESFERKGKGKQTYSARPHTKTETR